MLTHSAELRQMTDQAKRGRSYEIFYYSIPK